MSGTRKFANVATVLLCTALGLLHADVGAIDAFEETPKRCTTGLKFTPAIVSFAVEVQSAKSARSEEYLRLVSQRPVCLLTLRFATA